VIDGSERLRISALALEGVFPGYGGRNIQKLEVRAQDGDSFGWQNELA
jgi:hypothetical protein